MVEPYLLHANGNSTSVQAHHSWQSEHTFAKTERNDNTNHQFDSDDNDDDVQFISEIRSDPSRPAHTVDLSKSIFDLGSVNEIHLNEHSTDTDPIAIDINAIYSLPKYHTRRTITTSQLIHDTNIAFANPFSQTLPQITVANFAKESVLDNDSNGNGVNASNDIYHDSNWLKDANSVNHFFANGVTEQLPNTQLTTSALAISTATLSATNNPQPSTSNYDWHLPYTDVTNFNAAPTYNASNNKPKINHQIHTNFALPTPLPFVPQQNQPGPSEIAQQIIQQIPIPEEVPPQETKLPIPLSQQNLQGPSRLVHQLRQQIEITEQVPPPDQKANCLASLPFVPQQNQPPPHNNFVLPTPITANNWNSEDMYGVNLPNQTLSATNNPQQGPSTSNYDWHLPYLDVSNSNAAPAQNTTDNQIYNNIPFSTPLPFVPQKNRSGPSHQERKQIEILEHVPQPPQQVKFPTPLPFVPQQNQPGSSGLTHQLRQQIEIPEQVPFQQAKLLTPLPFVLQQNQPGPSKLAHPIRQQIEIPKQVPPVHQLVKLPTPLPFVPQQSQPGPSRLAHQLTQQIEIPEKVPPPQQAKVPTPLPFVPQRNQPGPSRLPELEQQIIMQQERAVYDTLRRKWNNPVFSKVSPPPQQAKVPTPLPFVPQRNQPGPSRLAELEQQIIMQQERAVYDTLRREWNNPVFSKVPPPQQAKVPTPLPFVPQRNQPGRSKFAEIKQQLIMEHKRAIDDLTQQENNQVFPPYAATDIHSAQNHTPISKNIKRKHTDVMPIYIIRSTEQYETLVEMGFLKKDIETALRICNLDLYKTIEYLSEPERAVKRQKQDQNSPNQFNTETPNQIQQSHEVPKEVIAEPRKKPANLYEELLYLEETGGIVKSIESFDCEICLETIEMKDGMILRNCLHRYCKDCLNGTIVHSDEVEIKCPYVNCEEMLQDREIRAVLSQEDYEKYLMKSVRVAQVTISGTILCNLPDCNGWCICEDVINEFKCPQCKNINCIPCKAIHPNRNCREYQDDLAAGDANGIDSGQRRSEQAIQELINKNEAMKCFKCGILIMKRDGCDFIQCVMCKGAICWATRGPRYGPGGKGDLSGGCGCTPQKRCHKDCRGCH